jgi:transcriptional regulator with XRE-family HTH domain
MSKREMTSGMPARLRSARQSMDMSQPELSRAVGFSKQLISAWECGKAQMSAAQAADCAKVLKLDLNWLLLGAAPTNGGRGGWRDAIPVYDATDATDSNITRRLAAPYEGATFRLPHTYSFGVVLTDASMAPAYNEGDVALIDPANSPVQGDLVLAELAGSPGEGTKAAVRRISFLIEPGKAPLILAPVSSDWPVLRINNASEARIIGCVVAVIRRLGGGG